MAQLASAGPWTTTITLVNTGATPAQIRLNFFGDLGSPANLPWTFPQSPSATGPELAATFDRTLNPYQVLVLQTTGAANQQTTTGWAQVLSSGNVSGFAIFSAVIGNTVQDSAAPLETRNAAGYVLPFDNVNGNSTGVAVANLTAQAANVTVNVRDDTGAAIVSTVLALPATGHTSFVLTTQFGASVEGKRGTVEFRTASPGQISVLGLRANATLAFSDIPSISE